jgi:hypothetical protein
MEMRKAHDYDERRIRSNSLRFTENGFSNCAVVLILVGVVSTWFPAMVSIMLLFNQAETRPFQMIVIQTGHGTTIHKASLISRANMCLAYAIIFYVISLVLLGLVWVR